MYLIKAMPGTKGAPIKMAYIKAFPLFLTLCLPRLLRDIAIIKYLLGEKVLEKGLGRYYTKC